MGSFIGMYRYNDTFYTGTPFQPDTLSLFIKKEKGVNFLVCHAEPVANILGKCAPIAGSLTGVARIVNSVKSIFKNLSAPDVSGQSDLWNAFKNLFRGIAEACPLSGIFLIIFDSLRNCVSIHSSIGKEVENQENIAGVAVDGKVIFTIDLTRLDNSINVIPRSDSHRLALFKELCLGFLKRQEQKESKLKMNEIFQILGGVLKP